ncbi:MAG: hypothetical protein Fur005_39950 [Roseiflexaceae bacterium]
MQFTSEQAAAIDHSESDLIVVAGAGSGKTRVLVERYLRLLTTHAPDRLLAITFTEKAAREMRERVRASLDQRARHAPAQQRMHWAQRRAEIEGARIGTIHSFCATLLRTHPAETGLDPSFAVLDEVQATLLLQQAIDTTLSQAITNPAIQAAFDAFDVGELRQLLAALIRSGNEVAETLEQLPNTTAALLEQWQELHRRGQQAALDQLCNDPVWQAATTSLRELCQIAPANDKRAQLMLAIEPILAAVTNRSTGLAQIADLSQAIGMITLRGGSVKLWGSEAFETSKQTLERLRQCYRQYAEQLEATWDAPFEQQAAESMLALRVLTLQALSTYRAAKQAQDVLDFDDLERQAVELLQQNPHIRHLWQEDLAAILVDEFQDTNATQRDLVYALAGYTDRQEGSGRLFVVGDGKQSIYRFRGAEVSVFGEVRTRIAAHGREIALAISFRAHARLIAFVNHLFGRMFARQQPQAYEVPFEPLIAHRPASPHHRCVELHLVPGYQRGLPGYQRIEDERLLEAQQVVARLQQLIDQGEPIIYAAEQDLWRATQPGDIAILCQASSSFEAYEHALRAAGLPFQTTAGRGYYGRSEVRDLIHLLTFLANPHDDLALVGILRSPLFALDDATILEIRLIGNQPLWAQMHAIAQPSEALRNARSILSDLLALHGRVPVSELLRRAIQQTGYMIAVSLLADGERRRVNIEKLIEAARTTPASSLTTFTAYLEDLLKLEAREGEAPLEAGNTIRIMTVHRAKGLEFPLVVLPDLSHATPPSRALWLHEKGYGLGLKLRNAGEWSETAAFRALQAEQQRRERAERERLAYVAMTRAQDYLILAGAQRQASGNDWLSWLLHSLDWPWEAGGPPNGMQTLIDGTLELQIQQHPIPNRIGTENPPMESL